jgi:hypothetical protein
MIDAHWHASLRLFFMQLTKHHCSLPLVDHLLPSGHRGYRVAGGDKLAEKLPCFQDPRAFLFILSVELHLREGKALGSEKGVFLRSGL